MNYYDTFIVSADALSDEVAENRLKVIRVKERLVQFNRIKRLKSISKYAHRALAIFTARLHERDGNGNGKYANI